MQRDPTVTISATERYAVQGREALASLQRYFERLFGPLEDITHCNEFRRLVALYGFTDPQLAYLLNGAATTNVGKFLKRLEDAVAQNPLLVEFAGMVVEQSGWEQRYFPPECEERAQDLRRAVCMAFIHDSFVRAVLAEPIPKKPNEKTMLEAIAQDFFQRRKEMNALQYFPFFNRLKAASVEIPIRNQIIPLKSGRRPCWGADEIGRGDTLAINIYEAVVFDLRRGCVDNAKAGHVLMNAPAQRHEISRLGNTMCRTSATLNGALLCDLPLPVEWNDLYVSWNLAVVSYENWPLMAMKLLNPTVCAGYRTAELSSTFLYCRTLALWLNGYYQSFDRGSRKSFRSEGLDWRCEALQRLLGSVNKDAAMRYELNFQSILQSASVDGKSPKAFSVGRDRSFEDVQEYVQRCATSWPTSTSDVLCFAAAIQYSFGLGRIAAVVLREKCRLLVGEKTFQFACKRPLWKVILSTSAVLLILLWCYT